MSSEHEKKMNKIAELLEECGISVDANLDAHIKPKPSDQSKRLPDIKTKSSSR